MRKRKSAWIVTLLTLVLATLNFAPLQAQSLDDSATDMVGIYQWTAGMGGVLEESNSAIAVGPGGSVVTVGTFQGSADFDPGPGAKILSSRGSKDSFIVKLSSDGDLIWAVSIGGTRETVANDVVIDSYGDIYIVGTFSEWTDFDPGPAEYGAKSNDGSADIFLLRLDAYGNLVWVGTTGSDQSDEGTAVYVDGRRNIYITGNFEDIMNAKLKM